MAPLRRRLRRGWRPSLAWQAAPGSHIERVGRGEGKMAPSCGRLRQPSWEELKLRLGYEEEKNIFKNCYCFYFYKTGSTSGITAVLELDLKKKIVGA